MSSLRARKLSSWNTSGSLGYCRALRWAQREIDRTAHDCGLPIDAPAADVLRELARRVAVELDTAMSEGAPIRQSLRSRAFAINCPKCGALSGFACIGLHNGLHRERKEAAKES